MTKNKIKIFFVLPSLSAGGAERVVSFIAQELDQNIFSPTLVIIGKKNNTVYNLSGVNIIYFEKSRVLNGIPTLFWYLKKNKPDIVMSAGGHLNTVLAYLSIFSPNIKFVAREVNVLSVLNTFHKQPFINASFLINNRFNFFDKIVCQSKDMYEDIISNFKVKKNKLVVINNPITLDFKFNPNFKSDKTIKFITVASLKKQKGHARILNALTKIDLPFHYTIVGDGGEKNNIIQLVNELGLTNSVTYVPYTDNVGKYLSKSNIFLQGSYVEGFPNSLIESCVVGTPIVAFDAPGGLNEIIINGVNGFISKNEDEYIRNIKKIINLKDFNRKAVSQSVVYKFSRNAIVGQYEKLFFSLVEN